MKNLRQVGLHMCFPHLIFINHRRFHLRRLWKMDKNRQLLYYYSLRIGNIANLILKLVLYLMAAIKCRIFHTKEIVMLIWPILLNGIKYGLVKVYGIVIHYQKNGCKFLEVDIIIILASNNRIRLQINFWNLY